MYQDVSFEDFRDAFRTFDRLDDFSYNGARLLFDYLEEREEGSGTPIKLCVVTLSCTYTELSISEIADYYGLESYSKDSVREFLSENTILIGGTKDTFVFAIF